MDIEFIEQQYRPDIFSLMEMLHIDMAQAYTLYTEAGYNLQRAAASFLNPQIAQSPSPPRLLKRRSTEQPDYDQSYREYREFRQHGRPFHKKFKPPATTTYFSRITSYFTSQPADNFKSLLEDILAKPANVEYSKKKTVYEGMQECWESKFVVMFHVIHFKTPKLKPILQQLYGDQYTAKILFEGYINVGINGQTYKVQETMSPYLMLPHHNNSLLIYRVNAVDKIILLAQIPLMNVPIDQIKRTIKSVKQRSIQLELIDAHMGKQYEQELIGNYQYKGIVNLKDRKRMQEDRNIRKKQEEEYEEAVMMKCIQTTTNVLEQSKELIQTKRKEVRKALNIYTEGMNIKLRVPSGESIIIVVSKEEKADYLFQYIESEERDLGFQNENQRKFEIVRPYDGLNLNEKRYQTLKAIFEDSENEAIVVREV